MGAGIRQSWETIIRSAKLNRQNIKRPQQSLWSFDLMLSCLIILTITFFVLTFYSILQTNADLFHLETERWLSIKILDTSTSATLFVTLLGALLVRHQFALSILPRINYTSTITTRQDTRNSAISHETWRVEIRNTGLGAAIINRTEYQIQLFQASSSHFFKTYHDIVTELAKIDLVLAQDYWLGNMSSGFSLAPKDEFLVFEIKTEHISKLKRLNLVIYFQGQLSDKYFRKISLVPYSK